MANFDEYGLLYNPQVFVDSHNLAAAGWHVWSGSEMLALYIASLPGAGATLKEEGTTHWTTNQTGNLSGLSLRGAGMRDGTTGAFSQLKLQNTIGGVNDGEDPSLTAYLNVVDEDGTVTISYPSANLGMSARLIKDSTTLSEGQFGTYTGNDGTVYDTVCFGGVEYLAENLRETEFRDHTPIPIITDNAAWAAATGSACCAYENDWVVAESSEIITPSQSTVSSNYGIRYTSGFYDRWGDTYLIDFLKKDYTGEEEEILLSFNPLLFRGEPAESDQFNSIKAKSVVIKIISHYYQQYLELYDLESDQFLCEIYYKGDLIFRGLVLPEETQEEYINIAHDIEITAVDGLSMLDGYELVPNRPTLGFVPQSSLLYGVMTPFDVIRACLLNLKLGGVMLKLAESCDLYNDTMDENETPLYQEYLNWGMFRTSNGYKDCYTVLNDIVYGLGMRIGQEFIAGIGLIWLLEPVDRLKETRDLRIFDLESRTLVDTKINYSDIKVLTNKNGNPINVITDLSGRVEIDAIPHHLLIRAENGFTENLIKDSYNYEITGLTVSHEYDEFGNKENTLRIPGELLSNYGNSTGLKYYLGYVKIRSLTSLEVKLDWTGTGRLEIRLVLFATNGKVYEMLPTATLQWVEFNTLGNYSGIYSMDPDPDVAVQSVNITEIPTNIDREGTLVLILRSIRDISSPDYVAINLDSLTVNAIGNFKTLRENARATLSIHNRKEKEVSIALNEAPIIKFNTYGNFSLFSTTKVGFALYAYNNAWIVSDGTYLTWPDYGSWYDKRNPSIKTSYLGWLLMKRSEVYGSNRIMFSANILGHMSFNSLILAEDRLMVIDSWEFAAQTGIHTITALEIDRGNRQLYIDSNGNVILVTEDSQFYIEL